MDLDSLDDYGIPPELHARFMDAKRDVFAIMKAMSTFEEIVHSYPEMRSEKTDIAERVHFEITCNSQAIFFKIRITILQEQIKYPRLGGYISEDRVSQLNVHPRMILKILDHLSDESREAVADMMCNMTYSALREDLGIDPSFEEIAAIGRRVIKLHDKILKAGKQ
jgi:hypothetical protein